MKKIFGILFALVLVVSLVLATVSPVLADSRAVTPGWTDLDQVAAGHRHTVGLKSDGTVVAVGANNELQCDVNEWFEIDQVAAGGYHTVGLRSDGTVVAAGTTYDGKCDVDGWSEIDQVAAGGWHTVGLESDGTVVAVGVNNQGQCDVGGWIGIDEIAAGGLHTVGLEDGGTVVAVGDNYDGQCDVGNWTDIIHVAAGYYHTVGLKSDGTVVAVGNNDYGQCDVGEWTSISQITAGETHTVGLTSDGNVVAVGSNDDGQCDASRWTEIHQVAAGYYHTVGVTSDGNVVAVGDNTFGQCGEGVLETIDDGGTINALTEADIIVEVTGTATVIIFKYDSDPHAEALALHDAPASLGLLADDDGIPLNIWREVRPTYYENDTVLRIELYYTDAELDAVEAAEDCEIDEDSLRLRWRDPDVPGYVECSPEGDVVTETTEDGYSGYMWVELDSDSYPSLEEARLSIDTFGGYGHPSVPSGPGFCFIATTAYGTDTAEQLDILREFRDDVLLPNRVGAEFVSLYYRASPPIAEFISQNEVLRTIVRVGFIDPIVKILNWTHNLWSM